MGEHETVAPKIEIRRAYTGRCSAIVCNESVTIPTALANAIRDQQDEIERLRAIVENQERRLSQYGIK